MKTLDQAIDFVRDWTGALDGRDKSRFAQFVPFERLKEAGIYLKNGVTKEQWLDAAGPLRPWTEEEILKQLKEDTLFGYEKAYNERGLSAGCMFDCVNLWCHLLGNDLSEHNYNDYGLSFFIKVLDHYGWGDEL